MRKIIYAWNYGEWGGVQIYFLSLIKAAMRSYDVTVVLPQNSQPRILDALDAIGAKCHFVPPAPQAVLPKSFFGRFTHRFKVMASENRVASEIIRLATGQETIVHIDFGFWQSLVPLYRLNRTVHVFVTQHTGLTRQNAVRDALWRIKGRILAGSGSLTYLVSNNEAKTSLGRYLGSVRQSGIVVTYTGVEPDEIETVVARSASSGDIRSKYGVGHGPLIISVGQFIERKGCWVVTEALGKMLGEGAEFTFLWLSTSPLRPDDMERVASFGLGDSFRVLSSDEMGGARSALLSLVLASDIFVLASLQEGLPIALVEAMALGRACISTRVNAIPEAIEDGVSGVLIEPGDAAALAKALAHLINHPERRATLGTAARETALTRFNENVTAAATMKLYDSVWKTER